MSTRIIKVAGAALAFLVLLAVPVRGQTQDSLTLVRDLYAAAAYDEALATLNRLDATVAPSDRLAANQYRVFCLVALGRSVDAERAMEALVAAQPQYQPSEADASPRLRAAYTTVRQRMLPSLVQQKYAQAKAAFDRGEFGAAKSGFDEVLQLMTDRDLREAAGRPPLADLVTLATGFRDLSVRAAEPAPAPIPPVAAQTPAPTLPPAAAAANRIYAASDTNVAAPVTIRQDLPRYEGQLNIARKGLLEIVVNESGMVESATMRGPIEPRYDAIVLNATRTWKFKPAMLGTKPVKYRKFMAIMVNPSR
jgi:hypothetical protein